MSEQAADVSTIEAFRQRAQDFWNQWNLLSSKSADVSKMTPEIKKEYDDLLSRGSTIRNTVETVTSMIDAVSGAYTSTKDWVTGLFGVDEPNLGFLPLIIPAAVIVASLAAMGKWLKDAYDFNRKMEEIGKLEAKGMSTQEAAQIITRVSDSGGFSLNAAVGFPVLLIGGFIAYNMFKGK
jgi:hypothetical protein